MICEQLSTHTPMQLLSETKNVFLLFPSPWNRCRWAAFYNCLLWRFLCCPSQAAGKRDYCFVKHFMLTSPYYNEAGHANIEIDDGAENNLVNLLPYLFSKLAACVKMEHSELLLTVWSKSNAPSSYQQCTSKCSPFDCFCDPNMCAYWTADQKPMLPFTPRLKVLWGLDGFWPTATFSHFTLDKWGGG